MTYFPDLAPCTYFGLGPGRLIAIGWLDRNHRYEIGGVTSQWFRSLALLVADPWQPAASAGMHRCEFCVHTGGPLSIDFDGITVDLGASNVFVPSTEGVYVTPSLVLHYIDAHGYRPPDVFQRAVENCPPMRSMDYYRAISRHGVRPSPPRNVRQD
jgi:hypothetical protein